MDTSCTPAMYRTNCSCTRRKNCEVNWSRVHLVVRAHFHLTHVHVERVRTTRSMVSTHKRTIFTCFERLLFRISRQYQQKNDIMRFHHNNSDLHLKTFRLFAQCFSTVIRVPPMYPSTQHVIYHHDDFRSDLIGYPSPACNAITSQW